VAALAAPVTSMAPAIWWVRAGGVLASLATALVILAATMLPFFSSAWTDFEQDRAGAAALTGYAPADVHAATDSIVHDLLFGGAFDVRVGGATVLDPAEQSHMRDVRGVFAGFALAALASLIGLAVVAWRVRSPATRATAWSAVRRGAGSLATLLVVLGVVAVVAFDAAFELFHRILFPSGNFDFDPRTEKLVQLFPEQFWSETALTYGAVAIAISLAVAWYARRRGAAAAQAEAGRAS
jgi:integral membrane protein (TIGR01906 family)